MVECSKNLYEILNVSKKASQDEIKVAYKKLVRIYHPDINKSKDAEISFKLLNNAYDILSDSQKRKNYDELLKITNTNEIEKEAAKNQIITPKEKKEQILPDKNSIIKDVKITPDEAFLGTKRTVNILQTQTCPKCLGKRFINGTKCSFCLGEGEKRNLKKIEIQINKGIKNNEYIYVDKINSATLNEKKLFIKIVIEPPKKLHFSGDEVFVYVDVPLYDAILGVEKEINIDKIGLTKFVIPPLTKPNTKIKLDTDNEKINCYAFIDVIFPESISNEEKNLYDKIKLINTGKI